MRRRVPTSFAVAALALTCCSTPVRDVEPGRAELRIDLEAKRATTNQWTADLTDCSDSRYRCLAIHDRLVLVFPRACADAEEPGPTPLGGEFKVVAPTPHLGLPSGSYMLTNHPTVLFFYRAPHGITEIRFVSRAPHEAEFDPNRYETRWLIKMPGGRGLFVCS